MAKDACLGLSNAVTSADAWQEYREDLLYGSTVDNAPFCARLTAAPPASRRQ